MGWTTTYKPKGEGIIEFLARYAINCSNEHGSWTLLKGKVIKNVAYMAIQRTFPESSGKAPIVFAGVFKVQLYPKSDYNFGWKDMDESCLPDYYDCSNDILEMLSPTDDENSLKWRDECRKKNAASAAVKLTKGTLVQFNEPIRFSDGSSFTEVRVENARRGIVVGKLLNGEFSPGLFGIRGLRDYIVRGAAKIINSNCELGGVV